MSSHDRLRTAIESGILPADSVRAALGDLGVSAAESLLDADNVSTLASQVKSGIMGDDFMHDWTLSYHASQDTYRDVLSLSVPMLAGDFLSGDYSLDALKKVYEVQQLANLRPQVVIAPNLPLSTWQELFQSHGTSLRLPRFVRSGFDTEIAGPAFNQPVVEKDTYTWSLSVVPGTPEPRMADMSYRYFADKRTLPTVNQLLAMHALRYARGLSHIDTGLYRSWVFSGDIESAALTIRSNGVDELTISGLPKTHTSSHVGTRPPQWRPE